MMRSALTCPDCGHGRMWNVRTMRERGANNLPQDMAVAFSRGGEAYGKYETLMCERCGHTEWYARDFQPEWPLSTVEGEHGPRACVECEGKRFWYLPTMHERDANGAPTPLRVVRKAFPKLWWEGHFSTYVCKGCGWTAWYAHQLGQLEVDLTSGVRVIDHAQPCRDCGAHRRWHVDTMHETGDAYVTAMHAMMRMTFWYARCVGRFATDICRRCGLTAWRARELEELRHEPRFGVALLERARVASGGPYR